MTTDIILFPTSTLGKPTFKHCLMITQVEFEEGITKLELGNEKIR
jgi:hypothetical protein